MPQFMKIKYYPDEKTVKEGMQLDDPLLILISYDGQEMLIANIDDAFEHVILLRKLDLRDSDIDKYFRLVVNQEGVDWTFVCPNNYKGINNKDKRIEKFYADGVDKITSAIKTIGYEPNINIPARYRRHFNML